MFLFFKKTDPETKGEIKGLFTLHQAIKKAWALISQAQLEAIKVVSDSKFFRQELEHEFRQELQQANSESEQLLNQSLQQAMLKFNHFLEGLKLQMDQTQGQYTDYLNFLKSESDVSRNDNQELIRNQINTLFSKFEENLTGFLMETEQRSVQSIDLELKASRQLIETYKEQQLKLIDENIISMLERTLSLVLAKKLSLKEHLDLVYESLEKAKAEKFIV